MNSETVESGRKDAQKRRTRQLSRLKHRNKTLTDGVKMYMDKHKSSVNESNSELVKSFIDKVEYCSNKSLYRMTEDGLRLITHLACDKRICNICNWKRQKQIRRKYFKFFNENPKIHILEKEGKRDYCTHYSLQNRLSKGWKDVGQREYDLMHLTLTVPHTIEGYKGQKYYFAAIMHDFNMLRKEKFWKRFVFGGEFGVECTHTDNGFHVHIHSLLMVVKGNQNRNNLYMNIFRVWNKITSPKRLPMSAERIAKVHKSFPSLNLATISGWKLYEDGSTMVGLENIYYYDKNRKKVYCNNAESTMRGVLETISYHFKPKMFTDKNGRIKANMIVELLPVLHKKHLYQKFGVLKEEKSLNVNNKAEIKEEFQEVIEIINEDTGEVVTQSKHYAYFVMNPAKIKFDTESNPILFPCDERLDSTEAGRAVVEFSNKYQKYHKKK